MLNQAQWDALWKTEDGKKFRLNLALMFIGYPPNKAPEEMDYRAYWLPLASMMRWPGGVDNVVEGMVRAGAVGDKFRPSPGSIRACALASLPDPGAHKALPPKQWEKCDPREVPELAKMREQFSGMRSRAATEQAEPRDSIYRRAVERAELWGANYLEGTRH